MLHEEFDLPVWVLAELSQAIAQLAVNAFHLAGQAFGYRTYFGGVIKCGLLAANFVIEEEDDGIRKLELEVRDG